MRQFFQNLRQHAADRPDAEAVVEIDADGRTIERITYRRLLAAVESLAGDLADRPPMDAVVMVCLPNTIEYIVAYLGVLRADRTVFPVHPNLTDAELTAAAEETSASIFLGERRDVLTSRGRAGADSHLSRAHAALLLQSSGTTGRSKIALRSGPSLDAVAANVAEAVGLTPADRVLAAIPLCHSYGIENGLLGPLWAGACIHACQGFEPTVVLDQWRSGGVTVMPAVPFMFEVLAGLPESETDGRAGSLERAYSAGAGLPRSVFNRFKDRYGLPVTQLYGATEIGSVTYSDPASPHFDPASVGTPMRDVAVAIVDPDDPSLDRPLPAGVEGHVAVRAPSMLSAYLGDNPPPLPGGFFLTGDLGRVDEHGNLTITGRLKLLIDVGGMKVNPVEVEATLAEHPAVRECIVVPMPVSETLVRLKAFITLWESRSADADELRRHTRRRLAGFKVPRVFEITDRLPRSPTGKIQRRALSESLC